MVDRRQQEALRVSFNPTSASQSSQLTLWIAGTCRSGLPGSYKIMTGALVPFQLQPDSWVAKRGAFVSLFQHPRKVTDSGDAS